MVRTGRQYNVNSESVARSNTQKVIHILRLTAPIFFPKIKIANYGKRLELWKMKLYSFISNEKKTTKQQGGNKEIKISLHHETEAGDWRCGTEQIDLYFVWENGKPQLIVELPPSWQKLSLGYSKPKDKYPDRIVFGYGAEENENE